MFGQNASEIQTFSSDFKHLSWDFRPDAFQPFTVVQSYSNNYCKAETIIYFLGCISGRSDWWWPPSRWPSYQSWTSQSWVRPDGLVVDELQWWLWLHVGILKVLALAQALQRRLTTDQSTARLQIQAQATISYCGVNTCSHLHYRSAWIPNTQKFGIRRNWVFGYYLLY